MARKRKQTDVICFSSSDICSPHFKTIHVSNITLSNVNEIERGLDMDSNKDDAFRDYYPYYESWCRRGLSYQREALDFCSFSPPYVVTADPCRHKFYVGDVVYYLDEMRHCIIPLRIKALAKDSFISSSRTLCKGLSKITDLEEYRYRDCYISLKEALLDACEMSGSEVELVPFVNECVYKIQKSDMVDL